MKRAWIISMIAVVSMGPATSAMAQPLCYSGCFNCGTGKSEGDGMLGGYNGIDCCLGNGCCQCVEPSSAQMISAQ